MKKIVITTLAIFLSITLVGCGNKEEVDNTVEKTTERSEPVGDVSWFDFDTDYEDEYDESDFDEYYYDED